MYAVIAVPVTTTEKSDGKGGEDEDWQWTEAIPASVLSGEEAYVAMAEAEAVEMVSAEAKMIPFANAVPEEDEPKAVEVSLKDLDFRDEEDDGGVRRRALLLRDSLATRRSLELRNTMTDVAAVQLQDSNGWTLLHQAAYVGRCVEVLLRFAEAHLPNEVGTTGGVGAVRKYCAIVDEKGYQALDIAVQARQCGAIHLLRPYSLDEVKGLF